MPALDVQVLADGLDHPWDVAQAPDGTLLVDERGGGFTAVRPDGSVRSVSADLDDLFATGETGLMGLVLDPAFADNRRFYTCQGVEEDGGRRDPGHRLDRRQRAGPGRPGSPTRCSAASRSTRAAAGTAAAARVHPHRAAADRHRRQRGGQQPAGPRHAGREVLRVDPRTGEAAVWTYGHRNVQGLAVRPGTEPDLHRGAGHQPGRRGQPARAGGNYGYDPEVHGSYDESVPMTDPGDPRRDHAVWSSGDPTIATCGGTSSTATQWGGYDGLMLLGVQKGRACSRCGWTTTARWGAVPAARARGHYGRIRTVQLGTDGALYVTTDNGDGDDQLLGSRRSNPIDQAADAFRIPGRQL